MTLFLLPHTPREQGTVATWACKHQDRIHTYDLAFLSPGWCRSSWEFRTHHLSRYALPPSPHMSLGYFQTLVPLLG